MIDPVMIRHGLDNNINIHKRGSYRPVYCLCTSGLEKWIYKYGTLPFDLITSSDRRSIYIDIYLQHFLQETIAQLSHQSSIPLQLNIQKEYYSIKRY